MTAPLPIVTMLVGHRYPGVYLERLDSMLRRRAGVPYELHCIVDKPRPMPPGVKTIDASKWTEMRREGMRLTTNKIRLFDEEAVPFPEFLYLDLTLVIQKDLKPMIDFADGRPEDLVIVKDWNYECFNSCVMRIRHSEALRRVYEAFVSGKTYPFRNPGDQDFLYAAFKDMGLMESAAYWAPEHVVSYRDLRKLHRSDPEQAYAEIQNGVIVKFYGSPKMHQVRNPMYRLFRMILPQRANGYKDAQFWRAELSQHWR